MNSPYLEEFNHWNLNNAVDFGTVYEYAFFKDLSDEELLELIIYFHQMDSTFFSKFYICDDIKVISKKWLIERFKCCKYIVESGVSLTRFIFNSIIIENEKLVELANLVPEENIVFNINLLISEIMEAMEPVYSLIVDGIKTLLTRNPDVSSIRDHLEYLITTDKYVPRDIMELFAPRIKSAVN